MEKLYTTKTLLKMASGRMCRPRAGARTVDLGDPSFYQGGQSLKLSTKAAVFKRENLLIGGQACQLGG